MNQVHLLDVGEKQYGDSILVKLGEHTILIDGGNPTSFFPSHPHESIPNQLKQLIGGEAPFNVSLLVVTHAHNDHIGCLPKMVAEGLLTADWALVADPDLGWGIVADGTAIDEGQDIEVKTMLSALREEPVIGASDEEIVELLADSETLQSRYTEMLETLEVNGTKVFKYNTLSDLDELLTEFADIGMRILGPSQLMLLKCANRIEELGRDFIDFTVHDFFDGESSQGEIRRYRRLLEETDFAAMDAGGIGAALNCMSIVLFFDFNNVRILLTGDMQFTAPGITGGNSIDEEMTELREQISELAPFDLYKIGHHGSHNSFNDELFDELKGTVNFAISTGRKSPRHPDGSVLQFLKSKVNDVFWVRTDRNGKCSFDFENHPPSYTIDRGVVTDWRKNHFDFQAPVTTASHAPPLPASGTPIASNLSLAQPIRNTTSHKNGREDVEIIARVPHRRTKVTISINVEPGDEEPDGGGIGSKVPLIGSDDLNLKPKLAFVTDRNLLAANIGTAEADSICAEIARSHHLLIDVSGHGFDSQKAANRVRAALVSESLVNGVVLLGGYDVVPSEILDVLPTSVRQQLGMQTDDPDNFIVWSDDLFGDLDGDGVAELPVSRIPDAKSPELIRKSLASSPPPKPSSRQGIRNIRRPFADGVFDILNVTGEMFQSHPTIYSQIPKLSQDFVYLMLHGSYSDASEFHGEGTMHGLPAIRIENIPDSASSVVFCGCCWGALIVDKPAIRAAHDAGATSRTASDSIPLRFLASGANAFVGCTGVHYSPIQKPFGFFGGPMHEAFWTEIVKGIAPAKALFNAKKTYIEGMFHGRDDLVEQAIEYKILRQFTCLGFGW